MAKEIAADDLYDEILNEFYAQLEKIIPDFLSRMKKQVEERFKIAMQEFYEVYTPTIYERRGSLYELLTSEIELNGLNSLMRLNIDDFYGNPDENFNIYPIVFDQGFHGGYTYWNGVPAYRSTPPMELLKRELNKYVDYGAQYDFDAACEACS